MIHRYVEEALNLGSVEIHRQHAVRAGGGDKIGNQLGRNRVAGFRLAVLAGITHVRNNRRNAGSRRALERIDHDQQFHQIVIDRFTG